MAGKKKSKKVQTNPARGFATVSSVSKKKTEPEEATNDNEASSEPHEATKESEEPASKENVNVSTEVELLDLSPDQLEARLEESELQIQIEKYREKSRRDANRYVSRLKTERRLLRASAQRLFLTPWIAESTMYEAVETIRTTGSNNVFDKSLSTTTVPPLKEEDLIFKVWTLQQALTDLDFAQDAVKAALTYVLRDTSSILGLQIHGSKDALWGADDCLDYLAVQSSKDKLPDYDGNRTELDRPRDFVDDDGVSETAPGDSLSPPDPGSVKPTESIHVPVKQVPEPEPQSKAIDEDARDSDSDIDPKDQVRKYLEFKTRLYRRRPDLTREKPRKSKKSKVQDTLPKEPPDKTSAKLLQRIRKLERDLLFDKDEAEEAWSRMRITLEAEAATIRKADTGLPKVATELSQTGKSTSSASQPAEDDLAEQVGELFLGLPEEPRGQDMTTNNRTAQGVDDLTINVRTFGSWTGLSPRRILDEACKARDSACRISSTQLSSTAVSNRCKLNIQWRRSQKPSTPINIPNLNYRWDQRTFDIEMISVSCPDKAQSEAFVSTAALFLFFSSSPKEEKVYIRLPSVWRELWFEFDEMKRQHQDARDRQQLLKVREMVQTLQNYSSISSVANSPRYPHVAEDSATFVSGPTRGIDLAKQEPGALMQLWESKSSSPAYDQMLSHRQNLPIWSFKETLLCEVSRNQTIILCGETGCGKSTQVPAFILEHELAAGKNCKIYCTQPRRISAISLARRVSEELGEARNALGTVRSLVGYAIRLESKVSSATRLVYATTGVLMRMLERHNSLDDLTHIVIDEIHERTIDSDFLLIILRRLMVQRPELKVILMSATVNAKHFSNYLGGAPVINVPGRTYPVQTLFLEDAIEISGYGSGLDSTSVRKQASRDEDSPEEDLQQTTVAGDLTKYTVRTRNILSEIDEYRINYDLIIRLLETIATDDRFEEYSEAILVFLPGIGEIRRLNDLLSAHDTFDHGWLIYPLHSTISTEEQEQAFRLPPRGVRKIVLATNIAETGITIPDITCVVDSGKHREMRFDEKRQLSRLLDAFISRANAKQRRGRAGRVQKGLCFHLFTRTRHDQLMADSQTPEMLRLSLQDLALRVKICKLGEIEAVLSEALDPPLPRNVRRAVDSLVDVKALTAAEELTALGRQLAKLPLDVYLGKLILLSCIFKCVDAGLSIAAILSSKSPFLTPINSQDQAREARMAFKRGDSDLLTVYNAYCSWRRVCRANPSSEFQFCRQNFLSQQTLSNVEDLKNQLTVAMVDAGFLKLNSEENDTLHQARYYSRKRRFLDLPRQSDYNSENEVIVKAVISWSFYPKLLIREGKGYRNLANNQIVSLHPSSINKGATTLPKFLSFYHIMQSSSRFYHAHETNAADDIAIALLCGDADFKMYAGILSMDNNRLRFSLPDWAAMATLKSWRTQLREIVDQGIESPGRELSSGQRYWFDMWQSAFSQQEPSRTQ